MNDGATSVTNPTESAYFLSICLRCSLGVCGADADFKVAPCVSEDVVDWLIGVLQSRFNQFGQLWMLGFIIHFKASFRRVETLRV